MNFVDSTEKTWAKPNRERSKVGLTTGGRETDDGGVDVSWVDVEISFCWAKEVIFCDAWDCPKELLLSLKTMNNYLFGWNKNLPITQK